MELEWEEVQLAYSSLHQISIFNSTNSEYCVEKEMLRDILEFIEESLSLFGIILYVMNPS